MSEELKLLPCPFCGADTREIEILKEMGDYLVRCLICGAQASYRSIKKQAIECWNARPAPVIDAEMVTAIRQAADYIRQLSRDGKYTSSEASQFAAQLQAALGKEVG